MVNRPEMYQAAVKQGGIHTHLCVSFQNKTKTASGSPMAASGKKKATDRSVRGRHFNAYSSSGNGRTPHRYGLTAGIGGADTDCEYEIVVDHEVRLLSVRFGTLEVYHAGRKVVKEIEVQSSR